MMTVRTVEDAYQIALKAEEKLARKQSQQNRGRSLNRGKGVSHDKTQKPKGEAQRNHIVTLREEEVPEEGRVVVETLFLEEEEEVEEVR
jgi:hypothetical protein